jgi:peptidyl-prolyl cis-trans isomerase B (cyclophilin B)
MSIVVIETSLGAIKIELDAEKTPITTQNFLNYVKKSAFDGTIFHRVIPGFMIQGGGFTVDFNQKETDEQIENEADKGLKNVRGSIAMARTSDPHSASSQFFINLKDNGFLDHQSKTGQGWGYCAFGQVIEGMDVVDKIAQVKTGSKQGHQDVPVDDVVMTKVYEENA